MKTTGAEVAKKKKKKNLVQVRLHGSSVVLGELIILKSFGTTILTLFVEQNFQNSTINLLFFSLLYGTNLETRHGKVGR